MYAKAKVKDAERWAGATVEFRIAVPNLEADDAVDSLAYELLDAEYCALIVVSGDLDLLCMRAVAHARAPAYLRYLYLPAWNDGKLVAEYVDVGRVTREERVHASLLVLAAILDKSDFGDGASVMNALVLFRSYKLVVYSVA